MAHSRNDSKNPTSTGIASKERVFKVDIGVI